MRVGEGIRFGGGGGNWPGFCDRTLRLGTIKTQSNNIKNRMASDLILFILEDFLSPKPVQDCKKVPPPSPPA
jgi:hypothetical protein